MVSIKKLFFLGLVATSIAFSPSARSESASYHPEALQAVKDLAIITEKAGETPVVIFDLDDTLINTRERTVRILKDLISRDHVKWNFPHEVLALQNLKPDDILFSLPDTLKAKGITSAGFLKVVQAFWNKNFFTNKFCASDVPNPGGVRYVRELARLGVKIVYLTGRDTGRMGEGTVQDLQKLGLPLDGVQGQLFMKQDVKMDDLRFKISMFPAIAKMGTVVGVFENEPANINAHHDAFPRAVAIFLDTIHSNTTVVPEDGIAWVKDFREYSHITRMNKYSF